MKKLKRYGAEWNHDGETWSAILYDRFTCMTWKFGDIWQCRIDVPCDAAPNMNPYKKDLGIRICLESTDSWTKSMKKAVDWVNKYVDRGPKSWEELCRDCYDNWPTLYTTEWDVISQVFFTIGNGYGWLDGSIISESPEDHVRQMSDPYHSPLDCLLSIPDFGDFNKDGKYSKLMELSQEANHDYKLRKDPEYRKAYCASLPKPSPETITVHEYLSVDYANIFNIPDNVTDEYLLLCKRIFDMFRYKNENQKITEETKIKHWKIFHERFKDRLEHLV